MSWARGNEGQLEHPENDLTAEADFANKLRPEPHNFDDIVDYPDPAVVLYRNQQSTKQAIWWTIGTIVLSLCNAGLGLILARLIGGPYCISGEASWLCSRSAEIWWPLWACLIPVLGLSGCAVIMLRKLKAYLRWRPWMGAFWVLVPHAMIWMITVLQIAIIGHDVFNR
ncbi:hypothetical protein [Corynebacterium caspium]|uniref:hypothetical protein n=1 Tax=Corynebacterium caspium TaxID=234828 RepID=UPI0004761A7B|nr:hypothetical protein [Corynebacterium caspium]